MSELRPSSELVTAPAAEEVGEKKPHVDYRMQILSLREQIARMGGNDYELPRIDELLRNLDELGEKALQEVQEILDRKNSPSNG